MIVLAPLPPDGRRLIPPRDLVLSLFAHVFPSSVSRLLVAQFGVPSVEMGDPLGSLQLQLSTFVGRASAELPNH